MFSGQFAPPAAAAPPRPARQLLVCMWKSRWDHKQRCPAFNFPSLYISRRTIKMERTTEMLMEWKDPKRWLCVSLYLNAHAQSFYLFQRSLRPCVLVTCCLDNNQQVIPLSHYFSNCFVLVSRWTPRGCCFVLSAFSLVNHSWVQK